MDYLRRYNLRKQEERRQDPTITPNHFSIVQQAGLVTLFIWIALVAFVIMFIVILLEEEISIYLEIVPIVFFMLSAYVLAAVYIWRIDVDGNTISYRNMFGRRTVYDISEITRVVAIPKSAGAFGYKYKFFNEEKKLFTIDENTDNVYLLQRLEERGIHAEKR